MEVKGKCQCCGKPNCDFKYIGVRVKRFYCSEECCQQLLREYYEEKEKFNTRYYNNIPQYDDDDGWGY